MGLRIGISTLFISLSANAIDLEFMTLDLDEKHWSCQIEDKDWVCSPRTTREKTQALIVISAKIAGPEDNLKIFHQHLGKPKMLTQQGKSPTPSQVIHTKNRTIGPQIWVESLHLSSEVPDFYTLYLATRAGNLSVLATYSASKKENKKFTPSFSQAITSMRLNSRIIRESLTINQHSEDVADQQEPTSEINSFLQVNSPTQRYLKWGFVVLAGFIFTGVAYILIQRKSR